MPCAAASSATRHWTSSTAWTGTPASLASPTVSATLVFEPTHVVPKQSRKALLWNKKALPWGAAVFQKHRVDWDTRVVGIAPRSALAGRRREFCRFADAPSQSMLQHLLEGEGGAAERCVCSVAVLQEERKGREGEDRRGGGRGARGERQGRRGGCAKPVSASKR